MFTAKRKGILALLISVMAAALLAIGVFFALPSTRASAAEGETVATIGDGAEYTSLQSAINAAAASENATITLKSKVTESVTIPEDAVITLYLNGCTITNVEGSHTIINSGTLTIIGEGTVDNVNHGRGALVNYGKAILLGGTYTRSKEAGKSPDDNGGNSWYVIKNYNNLNIGANNKECNVVVTANGSYSSLIANGYQNANYYNTNFGNGGIANPTLKVYGGSFSGGLNTLKTDEHSKNEIYGGTFSNSAQYAVMNYGETTISGGEFTYDGEGAYGAIYSAYDSNVAVGALEITGGTFDGGENGYGVVAINGADVSISGEETVVKGAYAVVVNGETTKLTIEDGTYSGNFFGQYENTLGISGGNFDTMPDAEYFEEGFAAAWDEETGAYVADDVAIAGNFVAAIGNKQYTSLQEAVNAVPNNTEEPVTVTLIGEPDSTIAGGGVGLFAANGDSKNIIIDFNGLTYEIVKDLVGSSGTVSQSFHLEKGNTVTLTNGKITSNLSIMLIQNYCNLTLDGIILDGKETNTYVVSNNFGKTVITGNTEIIAAEGGQVAFDVYYGLSESYFEGVTVCIDENFTGSITGKVEYGSSDLVTDDTWIDNTVLEFAEGNTGTFNIELSVHRYYQPLANADEANINVAGGTFTSVLNPNYIAEGANLYTNGTNYMVAQSVPEDYSEVIALETDANGQYVAGYTTLQDAVNAAQDGNTITLLQNVVLTGSEAITIDKSLTLDLGGYTVSDSTDFSGTAMIIISNGDVTITNGKLESIAAGGESGSVSRAVISLIKSANVTLNEGLNVSSIYTGIAVAGNSTLTTSANISTSSDGWRAIDSNGLNEGYTTINIKGGEVTAANSVAIYHPQNGELNISGGKVSGATALFMRGGELNISGGTIASTYTGKTPSYNLDQSGCGATSDVIVLVNSNGYTDITANITGGAFESAQGEIFLTEAFDNEIVPSKFVSGGNFDKPILGSVIAENSALFTDENGANYQVAASNTTVEGMNLVKVLTATETEEVVTYKGYASWADAYKNIADKVETTVILYTDLTSAITIDANKDIILDLNGFDINVTGGSAIVNNGTLTLRGEGNITANSSGVMNKGTLTVYAVTIKVEGGFAAALYNSGANALMTIESGTFESANYNTLYAYNGTINIHGGTFTNRGGTGNSNGAAIYSTNATIKLFGGVFNATYIGAYLNGGSIEVRNSATLNVTATVAEAYAIFNFNNSATVKIFGGIVNVSNEATNTYLTNGNVAEWDVYAYGKLWVTGRFAAPIATAVLDNSFVNNYDGVGYVVSKDVPGAQIVRDNLTYRFVSLENALKAAEEGDTIVLIKDVILTAQLNIDKAVTLDLNGYDIVGEDLLKDSHVIKITADNVTITSSKEGSTISGSGYQAGEGEDAYSTYAVVRTAACDVTVSNVTIESSGYGIAMFGEMTAENAMAAGAEANYSKLTIDNVTVVSESPAVSGNGSSNTNGTEFVIKDSTLTSTKACAIYHPQYGNLTIEGKTTITGVTGIEMRAGNLTIADENVTVVATGAYEAVENGGGTTTSGIAIAVSQHTTELPVTVNITAGTFKATGENGKAFYEVDTVTSGIPSKDVNVSICGGSFDAAVGSANISGFIGNGTKLAVLPENDNIFAPGYDAPVLGADGYYTTISVAANIEAQADVKLYAAALGIKWSELTEENAAAVLEAYDAIYSAATAEEIAAAKVAAMAELEEYAENAAAALESYKAEMIAEVEAYAAGTTEGATVVAVPTYVVSAIYGATSTAEIDKYVAVAEAEIDELRAAREEAKAEAEKLDRAMADIDSIISALSIAQGEGGIWTSALLEKIEQLANSANTAAGEIKDLIGTPATEGGNNTLAGMIEEAQNEITTAINEAKAAIVEVLEGADGNGGLKAEIAEVKGVADSLAALFDGEGEGDLAAMLEDVSKVVTEVQGNVDKIEADLGVADGSTLAGMIEKLDSADSYLGKAIAGIQTALNAFIESATAEVGAISGKLDKLSTAVSKLPTTDNSAAISELKELISAVEGKVDVANEAIDEVSGKVDTISDGVGGALASVNASIGSLAEAQNALKTAVEGYKTAVDNALTSTDTKLEGLAESIEGLAGDNAELKAALELLQQTADDLRDAVDAVDDGNQTDLTAISAAVATLQQSVTELAGNVDAVAGTVNGVAQNNEDTLGGVVALYTFMAVIVVLLVVVLVIVSLKRKR